MHPNYVALSEVTLYAGEWLNGVYRICAKMAAVLHGTSHTTKEHCQYTTSVDINPFTAMMSLKNNQ